MSFVPPPPERESLRAKHVVAAFGLGLAAVALTLSAARLWEAHALPEAKAPPPQVGAKEIARVFQAPFPLENSARDEREAQRARLDGYGWVDRERGIIHLPIERAMQLIVSSEPAP